MSPETECIANGIVYRPLSGCIEGEIQFLIDLIIRIFKVDRGRNDIVPGSQDAGDGFNSTGGSKQMPGHGFCGTDA